MNEKEKQIEEMAKDLEQAKYWAMGTVGSLNNGFGGWYGVYMYNQGYRKQSEVAKEFVDRLILELIALRSEEFDGKELAINGKTYKYLVMRAKEIAAEYGVEVEK